MSGICRAAGYAIIRAARWIQWRALGLRVPACRIRESDLERQIFQADERIRIAEAELAYWRQHLAVLEYEMDAAWRDSLALSAKIDAARGIEAPGRVATVKQSLTVAGASAEAIAERRSA